MPLKTLKSKDFNWINIENLDEENDLKYLKDNFKFHPLDYEDVVGRTQRPKVDIYRNYLFLVLHFPKIIKPVNRLINDEVKIFISKKYLITISKGRSDALSDYFQRRLTQGRNKNIIYPGDPLKSTTGYLLYKILEVLFKSNLPLLDNVGHDIREIEEEIYEGNIKSVVKNLGIIRRNILNFRMVIDPQRFIVNTLINTKKDFLPLELDIYFDNIRDYIENIWVILNNYKDSITGLYETNESLISHHTNEVIKILTIFSVSMLPLTLLSGIYGMNINLPFSHHPAAVWLIFGLVFMAIFIVLLVLKKRDWL